MSSNVSIQSKPSLLSTVCPERLQVEPWGRALLEQTGGAAVWALPPLLLESFSRVVSFFPLAISLPSTMHARHGALILRWTSPVS